MRAWSAWPLIGVCLHHVVQEIVEKEVMAQRTASAGYRGVPDDHLAIDKAEVVVVGTGVCFFPHAAAPTLRNHVACLSFQYLLHESQFFLI